MNIEQSILMPQDDDTFVLLNRMGPARPNMAVVGPAMVPALPCPSNMGIANAANGSYEPMMDTQLSIEEMELPFGEESNTNTTGVKIVFLN